MKAARPPPRQPPEFIISPLAFGEQEGGKKWENFFLLMLTCCCLLIALSCSLYSGICLPSCHLKDVEQIFPLASSIDLHIFAASEEREKKSFS